MRFYFLIAIISLGIQSNAQSNNAIESYGKKYFEHYQKKDFDWIWNNLDTYYNLMADYGNKKKNTTWRQTDSARVQYQESLNDEYGVKGLIPECSYVKTIANKYPVKYSFLRKQMRYEIKIVYEDKKERQYILSIGYWLRSPSGNWSFNGRETPAYYYGELKNPKFDIWFLKYPTDTIIDKIIARQAAFGKAKEDEYQERVKQQEKIIEENKRKIAQGLPTEEPVPRLGDPFRYFIVEQYPEFPGGHDNLLKEIAGHLVYPKKAKRNRIEGTVYVSYMVSKLGYISPQSVRLYKGFNSDCNEEALRVVRNIKTKWKPAKYNGQPRNIEFVVPVEFKLDNITE